MVTAAKFARHAQTSAPGGQRGAELLEMAIVLPLLLMLLIGLISMGRAYNTYQTMTRAAREGARMAVLTDCAACGNHALSADDVRLNFVEPALAAANLDPTKIRDSYSQEFQWLDDSTPPQQCGIVIKFNYPYQLVLPFTSLNFSTLNLSTTVRMRLEDQKRGGTCATP